MYDMPSDFESLSGIPMVGYRNKKASIASCHVEFIRHSDGGVSEQHNHEAIATN